MSQPYPPGGGPPPGQPPYGQQQPPYGQQQPYGQPPQQYGQQPYGYQQGYTPAPTPPPVVEANPFERGISLAAYMWVALVLAVGAFGGVASPLAGVTSGGSILSLYNLGNGFDFSLNIAPLVILALPLGVMAAARGNQFVSFHAKQALFIGVFYLVARIIVGLLLLVPQVYVQGILVYGILIGGVQFLFAYLACVGGARAFLNRELYRVPVVGSMA